jgi:hypothetical protein
MKHKPIRIDWDELEVAFTNHDEEIVYYLDLVMGKVLIEGEGEDDDFDDDDDFSANRLVSSPPPPVDDSTRAYARPITTALKLGWMKQFLEDKDNGINADDRADLEAALASEDPAAALSEFLIGADEARDAWYLYRSDRLHDHIQSWLDEHEVTVIDPAPWA